MPETNRYAQDMTGAFNTQLTAREEALFMEWAVHTNRVRDLYNYDLRGAWLELSGGTMSEDARGHLGDKYKKPNHPTFSDQSKYAKDMPERAGKWSTGAHGTNTYSAKGLNYDEYRSLQQYFQVVEPNSILEVSH